MKQEMLKAWQYTYTKCNIIFRSCVVKGVRNWHIGDFYQETTFINLQKYSHRCFAEPGRAEYRENTPESEDGELVKYLLQHSNKVSDQATESFLGTFAVAYSPAEKQNDCFHIVLSYSHLLIN